MNLFKIKNKFTLNKEFKRLFENILSLLFLQGTNYLLPLITMPYLVRVLGPEYYGLIAFSAALTAYFILISDYGFNLSATSQISINRDSPDKINEIFSAVISVKIILMILSFMIMLIIILIFEKFNEHYLLYLVNFGMVIGQVLLPVWLFQGLEQMKYIAYLNLGAKLFFTICVFIFVHEQDDYLLVPLLTSIGFIVVGVISLLVIKKNYDVKFTLQKKSTIKAQFILGWHVFLSKISISFYTNTITFVLGLTSNNTTVGYYAAADKLIQAAKSIYSPVAQAIYPMIGKKLLNSRSDGLQLIQKIKLGVFPIMAVISMMIFLFSDSIVLLLFGEEFSQSIIFVKIMSILPLVIALSNLYGVQTLLNLGYKKTFSNVLLLAATLGVALSFVLIPTYKGLGSAITVVIVEVSVTLTMFILVKKKLKNEKF